MSEKNSMKVTDRRMFTPDGELREEYRHLEESVAQEPAQAAAAPVDAPASREADAGTPDGGVSPAAGPPDRAPSPEEEEDPNQPGILDLLKLLAENASIHLSQADVPDGQQRENIDLAKLYIDLLGALQRKTAGNLTREEEAVLEDVLYRLRLAYTDRRGF